MCGIGHRPRMHAATVSSADIKVEHSEIRLPSVANRRANHIESGTSHKLLDRKTYMQREIDGSRQVRIVPQSAPDTRISPHRAWHVPLAKPTSGW